MLDHRKLINLIEETKLLELWVIGSILHQDWQPKDIDFVIIGSKEEYNKISPELREIKYDLPHSYLFFDIEKVSENIRYAQKDFIVLNALCNNSKLLSKNLFNLSFQKISPSEIQFGRLFSLFISLYFWKETKKQITSLDTMQVNALALSIENSSFTQTKQMILRHSDSVLRESLIDYDSIYNLAKDNFRNIICYDLEPLKISDLDLDTVLLIRSNFKVWLKNKNDLNSAIKSSVMTFFQA